MSADTMRFRVTDERSFEVVIDVESPIQLTRGVLSACTAWIMGRQPKQWRIAGSDRSATHPKLAHPARLREIRAWHAERLARPNSTDEQRASWSAQVQTWNHEANRDLAPSLRLHLWGGSEIRGWVTFVWSEPDGRLLAAGSAGAPTVGVEFGVERATHFWPQAKRMLTFLDELDALAGHVEEQVRRALYPSPRLVAETMGEHVDSREGK